MNKLTNEEKDIENSMESLIPVSGKKREQIDSILKGARKNRAISLRIAEHDLNRLKEKAANDGIPYQTLINTVLHKYITNQLLEKKEILKSLEILKSMNE